MVLSCPRFDDFASGIAHREDLVVAKMDGQANDLPLSGFDVKAWLRASCYSATDVSRAAA